VTHADARRPDRREEYRALDLGRVLRDNVDWYEERFVGRQMSSEILELYTNLRTIEVSFIGSGDEPIRIDELPVSEDLVAAVSRGDLLASSVYAVILWDFNTVMDVTAPVRERLTATNQMVEASSG
jgi:hypothetical protein